MNTTTTNINTMSHGKKFVAAAMGVALSAMLACAPLASAAEVTGPVADANSAAITAPLQGDNATASENAPAKAASKNTKMKANRWYSGYEYANGVKLKCSFKISKPKVKVSGSKKTIKYTYTCKYAMPSKAAVIKYLKAKNSKGGFRFATLNGKTGSYIGCKTSKVKYSKYVKIAKGFKLPTRCTSTVTITVPKNLKSTCIYWYSLNKSNKFNHGYYMYV